MEGLLEAVFSMRSVPRLHTEDEGGNESQSIVSREALSTETGISIVRYRNQGTEFRRN
jgi:hypothetical protein